MTDIVKTNNKSFGNLLDEIFSNAPAWNRTEVKFPPVNISEDKDSYLVDLFAPGLDKNDFKVSLEKGLLTISYDKKSETSEKKAHRVEYYHTSFKRSFTLDENNIDETKVDASYKDGVLKLILPKKEHTEMAPKQIEVK
ncbi:Hsp20/alpha crystallin family protein [Apibacter raozihei]|uniref:Hsp20/alpha crystallin family protein n=1 Tax=Apibacter TaxID=1778601 RepID=UPI000FE2F640|nr:MULTISPECIES: Hsp20/alpha crystallin family protein [Apibacter]